MAAKQMPKALKFDIVEPKPEEQQVILSSELNEADVQLFLRKNPDFLQRFMGQNGGSPPPRTPRNYLSPNTVSEGSRNSLTDELFRQMIHRRVSASGFSALPRGSSSDTLSGLDENDALIELIRDIASEFDVNRLCRKIIHNVSRLTGADRGSLFLAKGSRNSRYLVAKVFDVCGGESLSTDNGVYKQRGEFRIPYGTGIAGYVAQTKQVINLTDAYRDQRFDPSFDAITGYRTSTMLCVPVCNHHGDVVAVAQIINKTNSDGEIVEFTDADIQIFQRYLVFCGIGIQNAQLFELSISEFKKNQILLSLARGIFEEQSSLKDLVHKILSEAVNLLRCRQATLFLCENNVDELTAMLKMRNISLIPNLKQNDSMEFSVPSTVPGTFDQAFFLRRDNDEDSSMKVVDSSELESLPFYSEACSVLDSGIILSKQIDQNFDNVTIAGDNAKNSDDGKSIKSPIAFLCVPIFSKKQLVIGVTQFIDKIGGYSFSDHDIRAVETFGVFCGLGIYNGQVYDHACRLMAKQRVTLECLSYHSTASDEDTDRLVSVEAPSLEKLKLYSFNFNDSVLTDDETCLAVVKMFQESNLLNTFKIPYKTLCRWVLSVKKNYRPVTYHNWRHGLNVAQTMFTLLKNGSLCDFISDLHVLGLLVACLSHDVDHRGTNNAYQLKIESPLAYLYSTSTMEYHHFDQCVMILNAEGNKIFQALTTDQYRDIIDITRNAILATDLALYFKKRDKFMNLVQQQNIDWTQSDNQTLLMGMMMTACDISAICKPWSIQRKVAMLVSDEFFYQGDLERDHLNSQPIAMMDRTKRDELPKMQMGFIDFICMPLYKALSQTFPFLEPLHTGVQKNRDQWEKLSEQVEKGLVEIGDEIVTDSNETSSNI